MGCFLGLSSPHYARRHSIGAPASAAISVWLWRHYSFRTVFPMIATVFDSEPLRLTTITLISV